MNSPSPVVVAPLPRPEPRVLKLFISYASEDLPMATAIATCLRTALGLGNAFAQVNIDRSFLEIGKDYREQIQNRLQESDVFICLYTGLDKQWPAYEIGYFEGQMTGDDQPRELVPIYFSKPPPAIAGYQGIDLDVPTASLKCGTQYQAYLDSIDINHPMCRFLAKQQQVADRYRQAAGFVAPAMREPQQEPVACVRAMMSAVVEHLKTTVEATFRPQKQVLIRTTEQAIAASDAELPKDAQVIPVGAGDPMSIFGLTEVERTWEEFLKEAASDEHLESWRVAIVSVITSSLDSRINVDNSQIIVSAKGESAYRVILTSAFSYYNGKREFNLYFVETLRRGDFGDRHTTLLLRGLELTCRFRFMFFERGTPFSSVAVELSNVATLPVIAARLMRELNLLRKDARDAGLDQPGIWLELVDPMAFKDMVEVYQPLESKIRAVAARILEAKGNNEMLLALRKELAGLLRDLDATAAAGNSRVIQEMTSKLRESTTFDRPPPTSSS
jgi:hypothetical protein